jgi:hypothetical protein
MVGRIVNGAVGLGYHLVAKVSTVLNAKSTNFFYCYSELVSSSLSNSYIKHFGNNIPHFIFT